MAGVMLSVRSRVLAAALAMVSEPPVLMDVVPVPVSVPPFQTERTVVRHGADAVHRAVVELGAWSENVPSMVSVPPVTWSRPVSMKAGGVERDHVAVDEQDRAAVEVDGAADGRVGEIRRCRSKTQSRFELTRSTLEKSVEPVPPDFLKVPVVRERGRADAAVVERSCRRSIRRCRRC